MKNSILILITGLIISVFILGTLPATACVALDDYGDAPDTYSTLWASGGAYHGMSNLYLGSGVSGEDDGQPGSLANADLDDGIGFTTMWVRGNTVSISVTASLSGFLNAWVDFNGDGSWAEAGDRIFSDYSLAAGTHILSFDIPETALEGFTYARFRLSSAIGLGYSGFTPDGEVEDYRVEITSPVPVPASLILFGMGLIGFAGLGRKKFSN